MILFTKDWQTVMLLSLQNKIWNLPDQSTILPKFVYDKEGKLAGPTQILLVRVHGMALNLKTGFLETLPINPCNPLRPKQYEYVRHFQTF